MLGPGALGQQALGEAAQAGPQPSTYSSFIGYRFSPLVHRLLPALRQHGDESSPAAAETNRHFLGRHAAATHTILALYRQRPHAPEPELVTDPHFVGRHAPTRHAIQPALRQFPADDRVPETNVSFIGRFTAPSHRIQVALRFTANDLSPDDPQHFLGRFTAPTHRMFRSSWAFDVQLERNVHFLGRFSAPAHRVLPAFRQERPHESEAAPSTHFIGRHVPAAHRVLPGFRQAVQSDIVLAGDPQHFIGRHSPGTLHRALPALRQNAPTNDDAVEPNAHFLGRFTAPAHDPLAHRLAARSVPFDGGLRPQRNYVSLLSPRRFSSMVTPPMPKGPDFSSMDVGEVVTGSVDFARWINPTGVSIAAILSVAVTDFFPENQAAPIALVGAPEVGTVPIGIGGSGIANMAVLQQWIGVSAGWADVQMTILTSDHQELTGWARQQVRQVE